MFVKYNYKNPNYFLTERRYLINEIKVGFAISKINEKRYIYNAIEYKQACVVH